MSEKVYTIGKMSVNQNPMDIKTKLFICCVVNKWMAKIYLDLFACMCHGSGQFQKCNFTFSKKCQT